MLTVELNLDLSLFDDKEACSKVALPEDVPSWLSSAHHHLPAQLAQFTLLK